MVRGERQQQRTTTKEVRAHCCSLPHLPSSALSMAARLLGCGCVCVWGRSVARMRRHCYVGWGSLRSMSAEAGRQGVEYRGVIKQRELWCNWCIFRPLSSRLVRLSLSLSLSLSRPAVLLTRALFLPCCLPREPRRSPSTICWPSHQQLSLPLSSRETKNQEPRWYRCLTISSLRQMPRLATPAPTMTKLPTTLWRAPTSLIIIIIVR